MSDTIEGQLVSTTTEASALVQVDRVVGEIKVLIQHVAMGHYELGTRLDWLKQNTPQGRFLNILEEDLNGTISIRTAQKLMAHSRKLEGLPKVKALSAEQYTKASILLDNLSDEELQGVEDGKTELPLEKVEVMSTRELRLEIKRLKENEGKIREEERKRREKELQDLEDRLGEMESNASVLAQSDYLTERVEKITKAAGTMKAMVSEIARFKGQDQLTVSQRAAIEGGLAMAQRLATESYRAFLSAFPLED